MAGCQNAGPGDDECSGKCDDLGDESSGGKLMPRAPETPGTISLTRGDAGWFVEVIGEYGEIVLLSETYASQVSALNGSLSIEENGVDGARYSITEASGSWSFTLRAGNGQVLGDSQAFATEAEATAAAATARELVAGIVQYKAALTAGARFTLGRDASSWNFELLGKDDAQVLASQTYSRRRDAITGIESVRKNGKDAARYQILAAPIRFILKAANGQEIATSATSFASMAEAEAAISTTQALLSSERVANPW